MRASILDFGKLTPDSFYNPIFDPPESLPNRFVDADILKPLAKSRDKNQTNREEANDGLTNTHQGENKT